MKLTILDAKALNPGDLSWDFFNRHAQITVYETTPQNLVAERIGDSDAVLLNKIIINEDILSKCPNLKYIGVLATGYNVIDIPAVKKHGITVTNIPAYSTNAVAQHVFALLLHFSNQVDFHNKSVLEGDWKKAPIFCYWKKPLFELDGKNLGIVGYGNIGKQVERIAKAFGMNVLIHPHHPVDKENFVSLNELYEKSDVITYHVPLNAETQGMVNSDSIKKMKDGVYIINTSRGGIINESDMKNALESGKVAGFGADVLTQEPMADDCKLFGLENCVLTPHLAWAPLETRKRCLDIAIQNFESWLKGEAQNTIY